MPSHVSEAALRPAQEEQTPASAGLSHRPKGAPSRAGSVLAQPGHNFVQSSCSVQSNYLTQLLSAGLSRDPFLRKEHEAQKPKKRELLPLLDIYPKKMKTLIQKDTGTPMFIAASFTIAKIWKQPECLSTDDWIKV